MSIRSGDGARALLVGDRVHETTLSGEALPKDIVYVSTGPGGSRPGFAKWAIRA